MNQTVARRLFAAVLAVACCTTATAERYRVGSGNVDIPPPIGFVAISPRSASVMQSFGESFPPEMRVIEAFASADELAALGSPPSLDRFFTVSTMKGREDFRATQKQFGELLVMLEEQLAADGQSAAIYRREPWALFHASGAVLMPAYEEQRHRVCSMAFARIGDRPLHFMSCTLDRGEHDRKWLRDTTNDWIDLLHRLNRPRAETSTASPKSG